MNKSNCLRFITDRQTHLNKDLSLKISKIDPSQLNILEIPNNTFRLAPSNIVDMRNKMRPIVDQGNLGSCTANALCCLVNYIDPKMNGSRLFLYYNERSIQGTINFDAGAYLHDGVASLIKNGICSEKSWPYIISKYKTKPPNTCYTEASDHQVLTAKNINNDLQSMKNALQSGFPFVVGILVYQSFMSATVAKTGMVPMPGPKDRLLGGHAIACVGYDDNKKVFIMKNSWGTSWGAKGYFYLPYAYLTSKSLTSDLWCLLTIE